MREAIEQLLTSPPEGIGPIAMGIAALAVMFVCFGAYLLMGLGEKGIGERIGPYVGSQRLDPVVARQDKKRAQSRQQSFSASVTRELGKADLKLTPSEYVAIHFAAAILLFILGLTVSGQFGPGIMLALVGLVIPRFYVKMRQGARLRAFGDQLSDTLMLLANSLRSGYSLLQGMEAVSREAPEPTATEFGRVVWEVGLGLPPQDALDNLVARIESDDLGLVVTAINVQHEVGGNLSRILDGIANTIRERVRIKGEIRSITAQQTLTGYIISALPIVLGGILYVMNPKYMGGLFSMKQVVCMPAIGMAVIALLLIVAGFFVMRKVMQIEV